MHCRRSIDAKSSEEVHRLIANPTLSIRSSSDVFAPSLMKQSNFAEGYNVLTGEELNDHPENKKYRIHEPTRENKETVQHDRGSYLHR